MSTTWYSTTHSYLPLLLRRLALFLLLVLGVTACGTQTVKQVSDGPARDSAQQMAELKALLAEARASQSPRKETLLIRAAQIMRAQGKLTQARNLLDSMNAESLEGRQFIDYTLTYSAVALDDDAYFLAQRILTNPRIDQQWQALQVHERITLRQQRADLFMLLGETETSIDERLRLQQILPPGSDPGISNQDNLWQSLMTLPIARLQQLAGRSDSDQLRGWSRLALINKDNQSNLEEQLNQVTRWQSQWPNHPASLRLPKDLQLLQRLVAERPRQVALILPQQGRLAKAGIAVRDGFMAAYYQSQQSGSTVPVIRTYDSSQGDVLALYQQAVDDGAQLVVGPLDKPNVAKINTLQELPVPVLAVNYVEEGSEFNSGFYQFGLAIEDEARQVAQRAWVEGHRYALILATDASWGERSAQVFTELWQSLGGTVVKHVGFSERADFADIVGGALNIDKSRDRYKALRGVLGRGMEFEPRRRQDIDMLFLVALPTEARQINPTLSFFYASELPVYATSQVYGGNGNNAGDRDLNGIRFSTLPWYFDNSSAEKSAIQRTVNPAPSYQKLYALGIDSFYLHPRLAQLQQSPMARFYGVTGALKMTADRRIERQQVWAQMVNGRARKLPAVVSDE